MLLAISCFAALVILIRGLFSTINQMGRQTSHGIRFAWIAMTTGAAGVLFGPLCGRLHSPSIWETALLVGIACHIAFERRRPVSIGEAS